MQLNTSSTWFAKDSPFVSTLTIFIWVILWLMIFEIVLFLGVPYRPPLMQPNVAQRYLEYGRSVEGKIRKMIGPTNETTVPVTLTGWLDPEKHWQSRPSQPKTAEGLLMAIYGMSFAHHLGQALEKVDPRVTVRFVGGPGAGPNHAYKAYQLDRGRHSAPIIALGISGSSVLQMMTFTALNETFEYPLPYTYPKYRKVGEHVEEIWPSVRTMEDFRRVLNHEEEWKAYIEEMKAHDPYFHPFVFYENFMDNFTLLRFIRRAWAKRHLSQVRNTLYHASKGFDENSEVIQSLRLIVKEFARQVRHDGKLPILMLFNNRGFHEHLYHSLAETIKEVDILTMNSHTIAPSDNPINIDSDGTHFSKEVDKKFAKRILEMIQQQQERKFLP